MNLGNVFIMLINAVLFLFTLSLYLENKEKAAAFTECIEEVSNKCSRSIGYAIMLEEENARLNRALGKYKE